MVLRGQDAWRKHPIFKWGFTVGVALKTAVHAGGTGVAKMHFCSKHPTTAQDLLPGFREATALFGVYVGVEYAIEKNQARAAKSSAGAAAAVVVRDAHAH